MPVQPPAMISQTAASSVVNPMQPPAMFSAAVPAPEYKKLVKKAKAKAQPSTSQSRRVDVVHQVLLRVVTLH